MTRITGRKALVSVAVVVSLVFGATAALAQEPATDRPQAARQGDGPAKTRFGAFMLNQTMEFLDVNRGQIVSTLAKGDTLADLAVEQGSSGEALVAALVAVVDAHLQQAVADGKITPEEAADHLARAEERITNAVFEPHHPGDRPKGPRGKGVLLETVMDFLDVNRGQIVSTLAKGDTLADLAVEQGSSGEALVAALVAVVDAHLQQAVADGKITPEEAADYLARAEERITNAVFTPHHPGRGNGRGA